MVLADLRQLWHISRTVGALPYRSRLVGLHAAGSAALAAPLLVLFCGHLYLTATNQTTYELVLRHRGQARTAKTQHLDSTSLAARASPTKLQADTPPVAVLDVPAVADETLTGIAADATSRLAHDKAPTPMTRTPPFLTRRGSSTPISNRSFSRGLGGAIVLPDDDDE